MDNNKVNWKKVIIFAGSYVATIIGSGFATGQEIMQFFAYYGIYGVIGSLITMVVFTLVGVEVLNRGRMTKPRESMSIYKLYTGKIMGTFLDWFIPIFLFAVFVIMISGAGATLAEYYGLNPYVGRVGMAVIAYIAVFLGLDKLSKILGAVGPIIIVFTIFVGLVSLIQNMSSLSSSLDFIKTAEVSKPTSNPLFAGVLYSAYNAIVIVGFLAGLGATTDSKKDATYGGILGAVSLMGAALIMVLAIEAQAPVLFEKQIPTLFLADQISPLVGKMFSVILLLGIFSTAAPLLWQFANRFTVDGTKKFKIFALISTVAGLIGGFLPFGKLVGTVYPYTGYLGLVIMVLILVKTIVLKKNGSTGAEELAEIEGRKAE